jgi:hypothetical protein
MRTRWSRSLALVVVLAGCGGEGGVAPGIPAAIVIDPEEPRVPAYDSLQLTATVVDADGVALPGEPVAFSVLPPPILGDPVRGAVSATGMVRCIGPIGEARVLAQSGSVEALARVGCVYPRSAIYIWPIAFTLRVSEDTVLVGAVTDAQGFPLGVAPTFASTDPAVATVEPGGRVEGLRAGAATIVASSPDRADVVVQVEVVP